MFVFGYLWHVQFPGGTGTWKVDWEVFPETTPKTEEQKQVWAPGRLNRDTVGTKT